MDEFETAENEKVLTYPEAFKAWFDVKSALSERCTLKFREIGALENQLKETVSSLVDTPAGEKRDELSCQFSSISDALALARAEYDELSARLEVWERGEPSRHELYKPPRVYA